MGFSLTWVAIKGSTPQQVHAALSLRGTGARVEIAETGLTGATLPGGWYLVTSDHAPLNLVDDQLLAKLSQLGDVVICDVEEHCMVSFSARWQNGNQRWLLMHDAQSGKDRLEVEGEPPSSFSAIRDQLQAKQAVANATKERVDYIFDIPVEVARSITGYRHDHPFPGNPETMFEILLSTRPERRPWWKRFLGT
jgi:hypothetical protein